MIRDDLIRQLAHLRPEMKILNISGYADDAIVRRWAIETGMDFLQKPFSLLELTKKVREVLDKDSEPIT
jgi:FixJ family two-component response regulator